MAMQSFMAPPPVVAPLADTTPVPENTTPAAGTMPLAARGDHVHERLTSVGAEVTQVLDANGEAAITFTRKFTKNPTVIISEVEPTDLPSVTFKVKSYTMGVGADAALVVGCVIKGKRRAPLPTIAPLNGGTILLLLSLINALNLILASLTGFLPEVNAAGARFSYIAVASSQP
jgi:hypothetical protein